MATSVKSGKQSALDAALQKTKAISVSTTKLVSSGSETKYPVTTRKPFSSPPNAGLDGAKANLDNYIKIASKTSTFWRNKVCIKYSYPSS